MSRWRPGAIPRAKGCLLFVAVIVTHFTFSRKGLDFSGKRVNKRVCVCFYAKHRDVLEKSWCACVWSTVNAVLFFFRLLFGCGRCLRDGAYAIYFVPFRVFVSSCSVPMLYVGLRVFISLYWFPVGWAEFLTPFPAVVDRQTFGPQAPETRQCLEERCVTAGHNCLICHWVFWVFFFLIRHTVIQYLWTMRSGPVCKDFLVIHVGIMSHFPHRAHGVLKKIHRSVNFTRTSKSPNTV